MSWDAEDRDKALSYLGYKASLCSKCGTDPDDWLDEEGKLVEPQPFKPVSTYCHGCAALDEARGRVGDKERERNTNFALERVSRSLAEKELRGWQMNRST